LLNDESELLIFLRPLAGPLQLHCYDRDHLIQKRVLIIGFMISAGWHVDAITGSGNEKTGRRITCCVTIAVVLVILWLLGFVSSYTMGGFIHILLVIAIVVILVRVISGRKPL
jgi:hypothetical protein